MPQTVINTAATAANTSAAQTIASGASGTFCIYAASGSIDATMRAQLFFDTPGGDVPVPGGELSIDNPVVQVSGPASIICQKSASANSFGVSLDT